MQLKCSCIDYFIISVYDAVQIKIVKYHVHFDDDDDDDDEFFLRFGCPMKGVKPYVQLKPLSEILTIVYL